MVCSRIATYYVKDCLDAPMARLRSISRGILDIRGCRGAHMTAHGSGVSEEYMEHFARCNGASMEYSGH